uniref:Protein KRI1 homolog n=1 Tax=Oncorhynchus kisutch TaxID=8019 RepID=A0A8C7H3T6_ONCKI
MSGKSDFKINSKFAEKYDKYRQKEELQRLKDKYGDQADESESGSESDGDSEVEFDPKVERDFYRTLSLLKKKDPKIYQTDTTFYTVEDVSIGDDAQPSTSNKTEKPMYLKDYERKVILERGGAGSPSYIQEQRELKESFRKFIQDSDEECSEEDFQLLKRRTKTQEEKDKEEEDYVDWLKGQAELGGPEEVQDMKYLRDYWNDPELDEKECFLRDFVLNKGYMEKDDVDRIPSYDEVVNDDVEDSEEDGESFLERQEDFERHYNFRFEEPDAQKIKTYPRTIATSVRSKDERRKLKREEVKDRKKKEKEQKHEQLKQLKNLKRNEIMQKLRRLQELTGNEQLAFSQVDLEGDFDPQQHDQLMQKFFGDEYYGEEEGEKPQFEVEELEEHWNWDTWTGEGGENEYGGEEGEEEEHEGEEYDQPNCEDPDFIMDADYDPSQPSTSKKQKKKEKMKVDAPLMGKKRKKSHFAEVITQNKPVFDPQEKSFEQYLDEYYKLDYEDIIDDIPCRFRYRQVLANDFGLSTDEILGADEKELNRWASLKKTCMFRSDKEEMSDLQNYKIKGQNVKKKIEVLNSFYDKAEGKTNVGKKRRDRIKNAEKDDKDLEDDDEAGPSQQSSTLDSGEGVVVQALREAGDHEEEFLVPKSKKLKLEQEKVATTQETANTRTERTQLPKKKNRHPGSRLMSGKGPFRVKMGGREFSGQRLKAYGLNPKRLHFRQLGRQKRKAQAKTGDQGVRERTAPL